MSSPLSGSDDSKASIPIEQRSLPNLATLLEYFIAAKRSLSSSTQIYEANETVAQARASIEEIAAISARNHFLSVSIRNPIQLITAVRNTLEVCRKRKKAEFRKTLNLLDSADRVVDEALERLSHVRVDLRSHPKASDEEEWATGGARDECHTLLDYTDQTACDNVRASIRESIDRVNAAEGQLVDVEERLDTWIKDVEVALDFKDTKTLKLANAELATSFSELEQHAHDSAVSLQSLIKHYDLCVKALRHTEGAGEAIAGRIDENDHPLDESGSSDDGPMTKEERAELLQVLQNDAKEVDAVVVEINELSESIQDKADQIKESAESLRGEAATLRLTAESLGEIGNDLTSSRQQAQSALNAWTAELEILQSRLLEMQAIDRSLKKTLVAYGSLQRRLANRHNRRAQITQLLADDEEEHRIWMAESKDALPSTLFQFFDSSFKVDDDLRLPTC